MGAHCVIPSKDEQTAINAIAEVGRALVHLKALLDNDGHECRSAHKGTCHYCGMRPDSGHDSECVYLAAKTYFDSLTVPQ